jgi:hypothetical protein
MAKTRLRRCAQVRDRCRSVADASPRSLALLAAARVPGSRPLPGAARQAPPALQALGAHSGMYDGQSRAGEIQDFATQPISPSGDSTIIQ